MSIRSSSQITITTLDDGVGISSIVEYYLATASGSSVTTGTTGWTTTVQTITTSKKYLWNYERINYTDGSYTETIPTIIGVYGNTGADGADGKGISSIVEYYLTTNANSGVTTSTSGWTTTIQTVTSTKKYLWNYEVINYTTGSPTTTTPIIIGVYGDKGEDGKGIVSATVTYQNHTNGTTAPTGTWVANPPTPIKGQYLWTRTITTYTEGSPVTTYSVAYHATDGQNGSDGKGISSTVITYQLHTNGTTAPTGTWLSSPPTPVKGQYLWTRTVINYTSGSPSTSYSTSYYATDGQKGDKGDTGAKGVDGVSITSVDVYYAQNTSSTTAPTTGWSTTAPTWVDGKFIWSKTVTTYSSGTPTESKAVCITGQKGATGGTGATGTGITSITEEYNLSTSKTTANGTWTTTPPTWSTGKYIWTRSKIVYSNPTSTKYTTEICDNSWEAVNEIEIGGRNLLLNSDDLSINPITGTSEKLSQYLDVSNVTKILNPVSAMHMVPVEITSEPLKEGQTYTLSALFTYSGARGGSNQFYLSGQAGGYRSIQGNIEEGKFNRVFITVTAGANPSMRIHMNFTGYEEIYLAKWKLEKGNKATDWTPAPEDVQNDIAIAQSTADGKNTVIYSTSQPSTTGRKTDDIWFDTDEGNRIYRFNGTTWVATQFGTNAIANLSITNALIADATIQNGKIANLDAAKITTGILNADRIGALSIVAGKLAAGSITTDKIGANQIIADKIATDAIEARHIKASIITGDHIAGLTIEAGNIKGATITADKIAVGTITATQIASRTITADKIVAGAITANEIAGATITANKMVAGTITAASGILADAVITTAKIGNLQVTAAKIANATITNAEIADATITGAKIADAQITTALIADAQITNAKIDRLSANKLVVTNADIADATIQNAKIANLDAAKINTGYLSADRIQAGTITGTHLSATSIDGKTITGATIRTSSSGDRLELSSGAFKGYVANYLRVQLDYDSLDFYSAGLLRGFLSTNQYGYMEIQSTAMMNIKSINNVGIEIDGSGYQTIVTGGPLVVSHIDNWGSPITISENLNVSGDINTNGTPIQQHQLTGSNGNTKSSVADCNTMLSTGFYSFTDTTLNSPASYGVLLVFSRPSHIYQMAMDSNTKLWVRRSVNNGSSWGAWTEK